MEFWVNLIETIIKALLIAAVAYGGIIAGKNLRARKNAKLASDAENLSQNNAK